MKYIIDVEEGVDTIMFTTLNSSIELSRTMEVPLCMLKPYKEPERKKGKWIVLDECANEGIYCSVCHKKTLKLDYSNTMKWKNFNFCAYCGADMRGEDDA